MRELKRGEHVRARVWLDELPRATFSPRNLYTYKWKSVCSTAATLHSVAVECFAFASPRIYYGLLGGTWTADETNEFKIVVGTSDSNGELLDANLGAGKSWPAHIGFPPEFLKGIHLGFHQLVQLLPSGTLTLNCAAHEREGSCIFIYERIAASIARMLISANQSTTDEELAQMIWPEFYGVKS